jgi:hypothetical protein
MFADMPTARGMKLVRAGGGLESGNPNGSERLIGRRRFFTMWRYSSEPLGFPLSSPPPARTSFIQNRAMIESPYAVHTSSVHSAQDFVPLTCSFDMWASYSYSVVWTAYGD